MSGDQIDALQERIRDLEATLKQNDHPLSATFRLTPAASNILGLLLSLPLVTTDMIQQRLEIATEAKVAMHRLRTQLKPFGVIVESKRRVGYWLSPETKGRVNAMVTSQGSGSTEVQMGQQAHMG